MMAENDFDFYTIQSFPGLADDYTASCFAQSMMLEDGVPTSTLSDFNTCLTSILMTWLSDERTYYGDFQCINKENNEIKIIGDGAVPPSLANKNGAHFAQHGIATEGASGGLSVEVVCKAARACWAACAAWMESSRWSSPTAPSANPAMKSSSSAARNAASPSGRMRSLRRSAT